MSNLLKRSISGVVFIIVMVGALLFNVWSYLILVTLIVVISTNEYFSLAGQKNFSRITMILPLTASLFLIYSSTLVSISGISTSYLLLTIIPLLLIFVSALYNKSYNIHEVCTSNNRNTNNGGAGSCISTDSKAGKNSCTDGGYNSCINTDSNTNNSNSTGKGGCINSSTRVNNGYEMLPWALSSFIYIGVPFALTSLIITDDLGNYTGKLLLSLFIILWACDVGAYCLGSTIGQKFNNRLFPSVSPKKTWIGLAGAVISAIIAGLILSYFGMLDIQMPHVFVICLLISIFGVLGDLVESQLKRNFGAKDSGNFMPGHGGMLDRFDGVLIAFPIAIIYLHYFVLA